MANLTEPQMDELRDVFALFANKGLHGTHHGTLSISTKDLGTVIRSLDQNPSEAEIQDWVKEVDPDGTGSIGFDEFVNLIQAPAALLRHANFLGGVRRPRPQPPEVGEDPPQPGRPLVEVVELAGAAELVARREDGAGVEQQRERRPHSGAIL
jgi:hypothetical protein